MNFLHRPKKLQKSKKAKFILNVVSNAFFISSSQRVAPDSFIEYSVFLNPSGT